MKLRLMICAMAASVALFAADDYTGDNPVYGVLGVTDTATSNTVVGVPWVSATGGQISLSNLVSTATLATGDIVYLYEGTTWYGYRLNAGVWEPMTTVGTNSVSSAGAANAKLLTRGTGLIVQRASNADPIYLCGRDATVTGGSTTIPANATMLIANPALDTKNITTGVAGDQIRVILNGGAMNIYEKGSDGWYETVTDMTFGFPMTSKVKLGNGVPLAPGMGAWYVSKGASEISW